MVCFNLSKFIAFLYKLTFTMSLIQFLVQNRMSNIGTCIYRYKHLFVVALATKSTGLYRGALILTANALCIFFLLLL